MKLPPILQNCISELFLSLIMYNTHTVDVILAVVMIFFHCAFIAVTGTKSLILAQYNKYYKVQVYYSKSEIL